MFTDHGYALAARSANASGDTSAVSSGQMVIVCA